MNMFEVRCDLTLWNAQVILTTPEQSLSVWQVTTLGQPLEVRSIPGTKPTASISRSSPISTTRPHWTQVVKTQMASNRSQSMVDALKTVWSRGGVLGYASYHNLLNWIGSESEQSWGAISTTVSIKAWFLGRGLRHPRKAPFYSSLPRRSRPWPWVQVSHPRWLGC